MCREKAYFPGLVGIAGSGGGGLPTPEPFPVLGALGRIAADTAELSTPEILPSLVSVQVGTESW